jgi:hypothetical protein
MKQAEKRGVSRLPLILEIHSNEALAGNQAKLASAKDQLTRLFRKVSTNFGRRLR